MKVVNMEHKIEKRSEPAIQHGGSGEKTFLEKKTERGIKSAARTIGNDVEAVKKTAEKFSANPIVKTGGKVVSTVALAMDKAVGSVDNDVVQLTYKSLHILSDAVRLGGKTVKVAAKTPFKAMKLSRAIFQKIRWFSNWKKNRIKVKKSKLFKMMTAAAVTKKYALKPSAKVVKFGAVGAKNALDKTVEALGNIDNDTVQFAKKSYDAANAAGAAALKTGKASARVVKGTFKTGRAILTKKGRRGLVNSVKRRIQNVGHGVRNVINAPRKAARAVKFSAKMTAKAVQLAARAVAKFVSLIASTAPWSLILIAVFALSIVSANILTAAVAEKDEKAAAGLIGTNDNASDTLLYMDETEELFREVVNEKIIEPLKNTESDFCGDVNTSDEDSSVGTESSLTADEEDSGADENALPDYSSQKIIEFNSEVFFPSSENADKINVLIEQYVDSNLSVQRYSSLLAALNVLVTRENGAVPNPDDDDEEPDDEDEEVEDDEVEAEDGKRTITLEKSDFETFIGTVNVNTCIYGSTFFIKTTAVTTGEACPNEDCTTEYLDDNCESLQNEDGSTEYYCGGHPTCPHKHEKLSVMLKTVEELYSKSIPEIYGFSEEEEYRFELYSEIIEDLVGETEGSQSPADYSYQPEDNSETDLDYSYESPKIGISSGNAALLAFLVIGIVAFGIRKRGG